MKIINFKVTFNDLYFWGSGWKDGATAQKWREFWRSEDGKGIFWTHFEKDDGFQTTDYLVETSGSIYLHPMGFRFTAEKIGGSYSYDKNGNAIENFPDIDELKDICVKCAEFCGGSVEFGDVKVYNIED